MTKPQTQALLEKAQRSIDAASILLREGQPEFAASRSYYAIFYIAEALLHEEGLVFKSHSAVHSAFGKQFAKTGKIDPKYHRLILDGFRVRQESDYLTSTTVTAKAAKELIDGAKEFLEAAIEHLSAARSHPGTSEKTGIDQLPI